MHKAIAGYIAVIFGTALVMFGCTANQKATATKIVAATTQAATTVQNDASTAATVTPPGSVPNDVAQIVMAITGAIIVIGGAVQKVIDNLPNKQGTTSNTSNPAVANSPNSTSANQPNPAVKSPLAGIQ